MFRSFKIQCASQYNILKLHDLTILCNKVQLWASLEWFCTFVSIRKTIEICNHFATKIARNLTVQNNRVVEMGLTKEPSLSMTTSSVRNEINIFLLSKLSSRKCQSYSLLWGKLYIFPILQKTNIVTADKLSVIRDFFCIREMKIFTSVQRGWLREQHRH